MSAVSEIILNQLGGNKFVAMTGAKDFVFTDHSLSFRLPRAARNGANQIIVTLNAHDFYILDFYRLRGLDHNRLYTLAGIEASQLTEFFSRETGLATSL